MAVAQHTVDKLQFRNVSVPEGSAGLIRARFLLNSGAAGTPAAAGARQVPAMELTTLGSIVGRQPQNALPEYEREEKDLPPLASGGSTGAIFPNTALLKDSIQSVCN